MGYIRYIERQRNYALSNLEKIRKEYKNKWVAISGERILDSDYNHLNLIRRMIARAKQLEGLASPFIIAHECSIIITPVQPSLDAEMLKTIIEERNSS